MVVVRLVWLNATVAGRRERSHPGLVNASVDWPIASDPRLRHTFRFYQPPAPCGHDLQDRDIVHVV